MNYKLAASLAIAGMIVIFTLQNSAVVEIRILFWKIAMSRSLLIFFLLATGIIIGWLTRSLIEHRKR